MRLSAYKKVALTSLQLATLNGPNLIRIDDVVRLTERSLDPAEYFSFGKSAGLLIDLCKLSRAPQKAIRSFITVLDDLTRVDIASNNVDLLNPIAPLESGIIAAMR